MMKAIKIAAVAAISMSAPGQAFAQAATQDVNISATVPSYCRIGGSASPAALNATVPVSSTGVVTTTDITFNVANVVCNTVTDVQASSQSGGVKSAATAPSGFSNIINYTGEAKLGTTTSTVNTATVATAAGVEAGNVAATAGAYTGALDIKVTPQTPVDPLVAGSYSDVLRVTLTPQ